MLPLKDAISPYNVLRVQLNVYKRSEDGEKATFTTICSSQTACAVSSHSAADLNPVDAPTHTRSNILQTQSIGSNTRLSSFPSS